MFTAFSVGEFQILIEIWMNVLIHLSTGTRACLGRMFGLSESIAFLTLLLRGWKVEPLLSAGETKEQWKNRVLEAELGDGRGGWVRDRVRLDERIENANGRLSMV